MKASACMMTPEPKERLTGRQIGGIVRLEKAWLQPTGLVLHFDGKGLRRVHINERGQHAVRMNKRWVRVDMATLTTHEKPNA